MISRLTGIPVLCMRERLTGACRRTGNREGSVLGAQAPASAIRRGHNKRETASIRTRPFRKLVQSPVFQIISLVTGALLREPYAVQPAMIIVTMPRTISIGLVPWLQCMSGL